MKALEEWQINATIYYHFLLIHIISMDTARTRGKSFRKLLLGNRETSSLGSCDA